ncbi:hypothetical protein BDR07DRAFT_1046662 [Suillus spraguei]|nr:hypothetical protein BDR07DRAFT_1046662 [Suillus spraguei]
MSFPLFLRRPFSTSVKCSYRTKNIPEDIIAKALTTQPKRRGRSKDIQSVKDTKPEAKPQSASAPKPVSRTRTLKANTLPVDRFDLPPRSKWRNYFPISGMVFQKSYLHR